MAEVRYRILGPLSVTVDGAPVAVTAGRDRVVLAVLLLNAGRIVGLSEITEAVWGADPPATARGQLQTCVSRLRRVLPPDVILTDRAGYGIEVGPDDLDAAVFGRLVAEARAAGDAESARRAYRKGLDLWRGAACAEIDALVVRQLAAALDERHALAIEDWVDLELDAGRAREVLGELNEQVQRFPLRERLRGQLMIALHRAGRQADALAEYRRARETLADELGIDPGPELQDLHRSILAGEESRSAPVRCLPRTIADFTGREATIERLLRRTPAGPALVVIDGMAGSGKTTLALHLAALAGADHPDAHLFVDLHGHSEQAPLEPAAALLVLLRQLGLSAEAIPADLVGRVALWRTELSRRRVLVVLDNAASSAQVNDLLPTAPGSLTLVTSRRRLAGLDGVQPESLPLLDADEATDLLARIVGDRVRAEPEAAAELVRRCGGLPLAIRLAGARLAHRPGWRVADLVRRLGEAALPELAVEDRTVGRAFALSYSQLSPAAQRFLQLAGVCPGATLDTPAAAALAGLGLDTAADVLDELVDSHLLEEPELGVYRMHDLLREYTALLAGRLPAAERERAVLGVLNLQVWALTASAATLYVPHLQRDLKVVPNLRPDLLPAITDPVARLERHRRDLSVFQDAAVRAGHPVYAWAIARAAWHALFYRGYTQDVAQLCENGLAAARQNGDETGAALMANYAASYHYRVGAYDRAREYVQIAVRTWERQDNRPALSLALGNLVSLEIATSRFAEAIATAQRSIRLSLGAGMPLATPTPMIQLAVAYQRVGRHREALDLCRRRLLATFGAGDPHDTADCLVQIQRSRRRLGAITPAGARRYLDSALWLITTGGFAALEAEARAELGAVLADQGDFPRALAEHRRSVEIAERIGESKAAAEYLHDYAATLLRAGDAGRARETYERSLRQGRRVRQPYSIARAQAGLAACLDHDDPEATRLRAQARELFAGMGIDTIDCA